MTELLTTITAQEYRQLVTDSTRLNGKIGELFSEQIAHNETKAALKEAEERLEKLTGRIELFETYIGEFEFRKTEFEAFCRGYKAKEAE